MEKALDLGAVDALLLNAIKAYRDNEPEGDPSDWTDVDGAAETAAVILTDKERSWVKGGTSGAFFVEAGFTFAMRLCARILADPLHVDTVAVKDDWNEARALVDDGYRWLDEGKPKRTKSKAA